MNSYHNLGAEGSSTSSLPVTTTSTTHTWIPAKFFKKKNGKVIALVALLLLSAVVLLATILPTRRNNIRSSSNAQSPNADSIQTSGNVTLASAPLPGTVMVSMPAIVPLPTMSFRAPTTAPSTQKVTLPLQTKPVLATNSSIQNPPSALSTPIPSQLPTNQPSESPTETPVLPSPAPSRTLSMAPTISPTTFTPSFTPTPPPIMIPNFRIRMHWEAHYFWQDEAMERRWCIECTSCPYYNFDETNYVCDIVPQCEVNNQIWIVDCDAGYGQIFTVRPITNDSQQIQIVQDANTTNNGVYVNGNPTVVNASNPTTIPSLEPQPVLCLTRTETRFVTAQPCQNFTSERDVQVDDDDRNNYTKPQVAQLWHPIPYDQYNTAFTVSPAILLPSDENIPWCLTNQHHPKAEEIVALKHCSLALEYDTGYWEIYPVPL
jgi:hypothetical protein